MIRRLHGAEAILIERVRVTEYFEGKRVWAYEVLVFELLGHPTACCCYAWEVDGEMIAILGEGKVKSALDAVRAWIMARRQ